MESAFMARKDERSTRNIQRRTQNSGKTCLRFVPDALVLVVNEISATFCRSWPFVIFVCKWADAVRLFHGATHKIADRRERRHLRLGGHIRSEFLSQVRALASWPF